MQPDPRKGDPVLRPSPPWAREVSCLIVAITLLGTAYHAAYSGRQAILLIVLGTISLGRAYVIRRRRLRELE